MDGATDNTFSATHFNQTDTASVTVWYNNGVSTPRVMVSFMHNVTLFTLHVQPYHMSAAALNAFHNVHLRQSTENKDLRIQVINHPLPRNLQAQVRRGWGDGSGKRAKMCNKQWICCIIYRLMLLLRIPVGSLRLLWFRLVTASSWLVLSSSWSMRKSLK